MKRLFQYIFAGLVGCTALTACSDDALETSPTTSMSGDQLMGSTTSALVPLNGIYRSMYTAGWSTSGNTHQCFGISAYSLTADVMGEDHIMSASGSGWFWYDCIYNVKSFYTRTTWRPYDLWNAFYTWVSNANYLINSEETMSGDESDRNYIIGQAYAIRAYSYFMLAQWFARTYKGHETEPCCPIYTEPTDPSTEGKPRSTVQEVYDQITSDINKATELLKGTTQQHISHISYAVAQGIKARIALVMEDWSTAASSAEEAIKTSGAKILKVSNFMGLNDSSADNVMWGAEIISDQAGMYASLFSHMSTSVSYGKSARKQISKWLYAKMGENDDRREWWDPNDSGNKSGGYQQVKMDFSDLSTWTGDYIWMRVEEMYLTAAEAYCRQGDNTMAQSYLNELMSYRDPDYNCTKTGTALGDLTTDETGSLLEEITIQRRIELWGEFGRIYDIRRLKQGFVRTSSMGWPTSTLLTGRNSDDPESYMWVMTIPQAEFDGNANMDASKDQNPTGDTK